MSKSPTGPNSFEKPNIKSKNGIKKNENTKNTFTSILNAFFFVCEEIYCACMWVHGFGIIIIVVISILLSFFIHFAQFILFRIHSENLKRTEMSTTDTLSDSSLSVPLPPSVSFSFRSVFFVSLC